MATGRADEEMMTYKEIGASLDISERAGGDFVKRNGLPTTGRPARVPAALVRAAARAEGRRIFEPAERRVPRDFGETLAAPEARVGIAAPIEAAYRVEGEAQAGIALVPYASPLAESDGPDEGLIELTRRNEALAIEAGTLRGKLRIHEEVLRERNAIIERAQASIEEVLRERNAIVGRAQASIDDLIAKMKARSAGYLNAIREANERRNEQERELQKLRDALHRAVAEIEVLKRALVPPAAAAPSPLEPAPPGRSLSRWWARQLEVRKLVQRGGSAY